MSEVTSKSELTHMTRTELEHYALSMAVRVSFMEEELRKVQAELIAQQAKYTQQQRRVFNSISQTEDQLKSELITSEKKIETERSIRKMLENDLTHMRDILIQAQQHLSFSLVEKETLKEQLRLLEEEEKAVQQQACDLQLLNDELSDQNEILRNQLIQEQRRQLEVKLRCSKSKYVSPQLSIQPKRHLGYAGVAMDRLRHRLVCRHRIIKRQFMKLIIRKELKALLNRPSRQNS